MIVKSYDSKSLDLAEHFLQDERRKPGDAHSLAIDIQQAVEDWFLHREILAERAERLAERRSVISGEADTADFMIMRWAQRNPRVCCSNHPTGESILFGGRRQP